MGERSSSVPITIKILFPRGISQIDVQLGPSKRTCEDVKLLCIEKLKAPGILSDAAIGGNEESVDIRPAFGFVKAENESVWLPSNHVFNENDRKQVYHFRLRHRPKSSRLYADHNLVTEFFVLQALDDFLKGTLGKTMAKEEAEVSRDTIIKLVLFALLLPSSVPLQDMSVIDANFKIKKFDLLKYQKLFSKEIYNKIITTSSKFYRIVDHYFYHKGLRDTLSAYKNQSNKVGFYKKEFVNLLLESFPEYCFERYSAVDSFSNSEVIVNLILYPESKDREKMPGLYIDGVRLCGLEDISRVTFEEHNPDDAQKQQCAVEIICIGPMSQDKTLLFCDGATAVSFITMLQGYITLCIRPDLDICRKLTSPLQEVRNSLKSFCPMIQSKAVELLKNENEHKAENEHCRFLVYESMSGNMEEVEEDHFKIVTDNPGAEEIGHIRHLNGKGFLLYSSSRSDEFANHETLRRHLINRYGQQLRPDFVRQTVDRDSMFFVEKTVTSLNPFSAQMAECDNGLPTYILQEDLGIETEFMERSADERLERIIVVTGEDKKVLVKLVPDKKEYIQALYAGMSNIARLYRLHPSSVLGFYGPVFARHFSQSYVMEHSPYGNLVEYMRRNIRHLSTQQMMKLALDAVNILHTITQPQESSIHPLLHGNLRGANFWVFRRENRYFLKLGDPGLVSHYNNRPMNKPVNIERELWLSPERQNKLAEVTVASEIYAIATTIAEIFHGGQDLRSVLSKAKERDDKLVAGQPVVGSNNGPLMGEFEVGSNGGPVLGEPAVGSNGGSVMGESGVGSNGGSVMGESGVGSNGGSVMGESGVGSNGASVLGEPGVGSNGGPVLGEPGVGSNGGSVLGEPGVGSNGGLVLGEPGVGSNGGPVLGEPGVGSNGGSVLGEPGVGSNGGLVLGEPGVGSNGGSVLGEPGVGSNGGSVLGEPGVGSNGGSVLGEPGDGPQIDEAKDNDEVYNKNTGLKFRIPLPVFETSEEKTLVDDVKQVIIKLWNQLGHCWHPLPQSRPSPLELKYQLLDLTEEACSIPEETAIEHLKALVYRLHSKDGPPVQDRIKKLSTLQECEAFLDGNSHCYIPPGDLTLGSIVGQGNFGFVYKGTMRRNGSNREVALKLNKPNSGHGIHEKVQFAKELNLCSKLSHPNIVKAFGWTLHRGTNYCMIMEYVNHGNLLGYAQTHEESLSDPSHISKCLGLCMDIAKGMEHCAKEGIVHCDLAARNVLLNIDQHGNITAKVADFGLSKVLCQKTNYYYQARNLLMSRPIFWYAPEYMAGEKDGFVSAGTKFTIEGDIWAYGITLWELFSGGLKPSSVFHESVKIWHEYLYNFYDDGSRLPRTKQMRGDIYGLMKMCWVADPKVRAGYSAIQAKIGTIKMKYTST